MSSHQGIHGMGAHPEFLRDLSCMFDGELEEQAAGRAMLHIEECESCRSFFEDLRGQVRAHRDMENPEELFAHIALLRAQDEVGLPNFDKINAGVEGIELINRLATVFYQLGKAYALSAIDPGYHTLVFEAVVAVDRTKIAGRGFVDGVLMRGRGDVGGLDWAEARHSLNGRLESIDDPLEKAHRLLGECLDADPSHEEARLYLAFLHAHEGKALRAAQEYKEVFDTAIDDRNRGHAAMQLGNLHGREEDYRKALACYRWITITGLDKLDDRFFGARFNIGKCWAMLGEKDRSLQTFRELLDTHPDRAVEVARLFAGTPSLRRSIDSIPGFPEELIGHCPELFISAALGGAEDK
jgi:tetratricopeptide (TPR) repeat protein